MMNLTAALNAARLSIAARSLQTSIAAENISNVDNPNFVRRQTETVSNGGAGVRTVSVTRADDAALFRHFLTATSNMTEKQAILDGLTSLEQSIGDPSLEASPAALMTKFQNALQSFATLPHDSVAATNAVQSAVDLASGLNNAADLILEMRAQADSEIAQSVGNINSLLGQFHTANQAIVKGIGSPSELAGYLDMRDAALAKLAEELDISTVTGPNNDIAIYAKGGVVLYEKKPRTVSFQPTPIFTPTTITQQVYIDGVPVTGDSVIMGIGSGRLKGLVELRDNIATTYQNQLDEMARGLIEAFAEQDQSAVPSQADAPGLFTYSGAPAMPASGLLAPGLASQLIVHPDVHPQGGNDFELLRDGGISGPAYVYNTTGDVGFSDRLSELFDNFNAQRSFDPAANTETDASLLSFSNSSASWFESLRAKSVDDADFQTALLARSSQSLSRSTGVDLDTELATMTDLERSYDASAKLLTTINSMFSSLLNAL